MMERLHLEEGWTTLLLLWAMALVSGIAIHQADLIAGLSILPFVSTAGIAAGLLLSKSRFSGRTAHLFALVYGLAVITFLIGQTLPADLTWRERIFDLLNRQVAWLTKAFAKGTSRDGLIFVMHTSLIFWILAYTSAWYTFREPRVWRVVLPTGIVLLSVIYYYYGPKPLVAYLGAYVILALLYVARTHLIAREKNWRSAAVRYESGALRFSFLRASFLASLIALGLAWQLPTLTASAAVSDALTGTGVNRTWRGFQDNWTRLFSSLRSYGSGTSDPYSTSLALGGPRSVGNTIIMDVYVPQQLPNVYWQAIALDTYRDGGWSLNEDDTQKALHFPDEGLLNVPFTQARTTITQTIVNYLPNSSTLYGAPEIVSSNKQMLVTQRDDGTGHLLVHSTQSRFVLRQGETYQVYSRLSMADAQGLRLAATAYPDWVTASYLQVPDTITQDTLDLAAQLTEQHDNPFDKAIAVRDYLRANIVYNDQIPAPPEGIEPIHYTLFISKEGYCNYYASAMAIMLRSQGIPARIVLGYAQGDYDEESRSYRVRASNAHTWVEVYFPGYGWIQFEPTASLPAEIRPETSGNPGDAFASPSLPPLLERESLLPEDDLNPNDPSLDPEGLLEGDLAETPEAAANQRVLVIQIFAALLIGGFAFGAIIMANQFNQRVEANVERSYGRLENWFRWLGVLVRPTQTPYERADLMAAAVPEGKNSIRSLTRQFVLRRFSRDQAGDQAFDPRREWKQLRPLLLRKTLTNWLQRRR
jgi:transglutaminase-like putative cysteine protease